jgi:hypothetical protein
LIADAAGNGTGGTIYLMSASIDDSDATGGHSMTALGAGSGAGGSFTLTSTGSMALGNTDILADGGGTGDGGTIELAFSDSATLLLGTLFAITQQNEGGGTLSITNNANADLIITVAGNIQTTTNTSEDFSDISGSISKTNPYPAYLPANVGASQATATSGTVYWGDSLAGLQVNPAGTTTFAVNGYDLVFYADGNTILISYSVTFNTLPIS